MNETDDVVECPTCGCDDFKNKHGMKIHHAQAHDECIGKTETECAWCGERKTVQDYQLERNERSFCSKSCSNNWMAENFEKRQLSDSERQKIIEANEGRVLSDETREKIRRANKGRTMSDEAVEKMRKALEGRELTEEHKKKLSEANKGREPAHAGEELPEEWRKSISKGLEGHEYWGNEERSEEVKQKISETLKGREFSEESLQKMSEARKGKKPGHAEPVTVEETGNVVRSSWEEEIDIILHESELEYEHEPRTFTFDNGRGYTPDFSVEGGTIIEVKGRIWGEWDVTRADLFRNQFSEYEYIVVGNEDVPHDIHISWQNRSSLINAINGGEHD